MSAILALYAALSPEPPAAEPRNIATTCAISGVPIASGYEVSDIVDAAAGDVSAFLRVPSGYLSQEAAALWRNGPYGSFLIQEATARRPTVAPNEGRPQWRELLRSLQAGEKTVAVVTSDTKRRLWPFAPLSEVGNAWRVFFHDGPVSRILALNHAKLLNCLELVERIYTIGFSKSAIAESLFEPMQYARIKQYGTAILDLDAQLQDYRQTDEMVLACFVAQKLAETPTIVPIVPITVPAKKEELCPQQTQQLRLFA